MKRPRALHTLKRVPNTTLRLSAVQDRAHSSERGQRRGFALITVIWLITVLSGLVASGLAGARLGHQASTNRMLLGRGRWAAEACVAIAQARWRDQKLTDTATIDLGRGTRCGWRLTDPSARLNLNSADPAILARLMGETRAAELLTHRHRTSWVSDSELGADTALLTVEGPGTVNVNAAPAAVLMALPGFGPEAIERLAAARSRDRPLKSLDALIADLSPSGRAAMLAHYPELARLLTFTAPQLVFTATGWVLTSRGDLPVATIELLLVPLPERLAVIRRRMW